MVNVFKMTSVILSTYFTSCYNCIQILNTFNYRTYGMLIYPMVFFLIVVGEMDSGIINLENSNNKNMSSITELKPSNFEKKDHVERNRLIYYNIIYVYKLL